MDQTQPPYDPRQYGAQPVYPPPGYGAYYPQYGEPVLPHTGLGIASFILAFVGGASIFCAIIFIVIQIAPTGGMPDPQDPIFMVGGLAVCGGIVLNVVGTVLGIAGLFQPNRKRVFAILGIAFNGVIVLVMGTMTLINIMMQA